MRCEEFELRLNEILDRRRNPRSDAELWLHATSCPECGDLLAGYQALFAGFKRSEVAAEPEALAARVRLQLGPHRGRGAWRDRAPLALIAAALVVVAILPGVWHGVGRTPVTLPESSTLATTVRVAGASGTATPSGAPLTVLARMAGDQFRFLAVHSEQSAALAWRLVPSVDDVIEGIEGTAGASRAPANGRAPASGGSDIRGSGRPGSDQGDKPHNPPAAALPPAASG